MVHSVFEIRGLRCELVRKPIKNLHLRVYPPDGRIRVSAPLRMNQKTIEQFIIAKQDWIEQSRQRFLSRVPPAPRHYNDGEIHCLFGQPCILTINPTSKRPFCSLNGQFLCLNIAAEASYEDKASLIEGWYREQLREQLNELIPRWEKIIGVKANAVGIKKMKTRWGSCNTRTARVWFSLMLAEKPLACLEYVVVHELVHLLEASHNHRFHGFMNQFLPDWQKRKALLNR
ncbi:M48 family peptidase [Legionella taurinensis]|uniref:M48 family peptidase n=1 Tax=Legionella taurinensis TaxID=70611 RepID=A0A3A5L3N2_9GAMM|nr:SprT family zinc-dependent metalloprotease [Legionella taurinensis]MDX1838798.1 SprT family zinc-dependent metalloprotease [Legionella taurinensis]PUT38658.1 hypothetical protein DB744_13635 [Legionella taurinensis]PUT39856.1 hypothetical protein DB746_13035 [Legionella taurinensis]PUT41848.1 hypothetical protein DB743_13520 [Legionella taurinensis]PUT45343.1 hypothetical protein DB745_12975 [Legionella taurinensis]